MTSDEFKEKLEQARRLVAAAEADLRRTLEDPAKQTTVKASLADVEARAMKAGRLTAELQEELWERKHPERTV